MQNVYPKAQIKKSIIKLDKATVANDVIAAMNAGLTKAQAIGQVLKGSDDVETFNEVWNKIEAEGLAFRQVNTNSYETLDEYKIALTKATTYLDIDKWYTGFLAESGVASWDELKAILRLK